MSSISEISLDEITVEILKNEVNESGKNQSDIAEIVGPSQYTINKRYQELADEGILDKRGRGDYRPTSEAETILEEHTEQEKSHSLRDLTQEAFEDLTENQKVAFIGAVRGWSNQKIVENSEYSTKVSASVAKSSLEDRELLEKEGTTNPTYFLGTKALDPDTEESLEPLADIIADKEGSTGDIIESTLKEKGEARQSDFAKLLDVHEATVSDALSKLEEEGVVEREWEDGGKIIQYVEENSSETRKDEDIEPVYENLRKMEGSTKQVLEEFLEQEG